MTNRDRAGLTPEDYRTADDLLREAVEANIAEEDNLKEVRDHFDRIARQAFHSGSFVVEVERLVVDHLWSRANNRAGDNTTAVLKEIASHQTAMVMDDWLELVLTVGKHRRTTLRDLTRNDLARIISERQQNYDRAGASLSEVKSVAAMLDAALSDYETIPAALDAGALSMHFDADAPTQIEAAS